MNLAAPIRNAIVANTTITALLQAFQGSFPVFTRVPTPSDSPYPLIVITPDVAISDEDGISDLRPVVVRDVAVYGLNDTAEQYRDVETIGYELRDMFHREKALTVPGYHVIDIRVTGPRVAPADTENEVGRMVELTIRLSKD